MVPRIVREGQALTPKITSWQRKYVRAYYVTVRVDEIKEEVDMQLLERAKFY